MATFVWIPDYGSQEQHKPRVRRVQFGDGYQQRSADGINTDPATWVLSFGNRSDAESQAIVDFLAARGGVEAFDWTPPRGSSALKWICPQWQRAPTNYGSWTVSATFEQVFEP